jgi:hypothetical protein
LIALALSVLKNLANLIFIMHLNDC